MENVNTALLENNTSVDLIASAHLRSEAKDSGGDSVKIRSHVGGPPLTVTVGMSNNTHHPSITHEQAKIIQTEANLSDKQMAKVTKNFSLGGILCNWG